MTGPSAADIARVTELVSAAYAEAMRDHGLLPGTAAVIRTAAEGKLRDVMGDTFPAYPPGERGRIDRLS